MAHDEADQDKDDFAFTRIPKAVRTNLRGVGLDLRSPGFEAAANGWALERILAQWLEETSVNNKSTASGVTIGALAEKLKEINLIDNDEFIELQSIKHIRNHGAHGRWGEVSRQQADLLSQTTMKFIERVRKRAPNLNIWDTNQDAMDVEYVARSETPKTSRLVGWAFRDGKLYKATLKGVLFRIALMAALGIVSVASSLSVIYSTGWVIGAVLSDGSTFKAFTIHLSIFASALAGLGAIAIAAKMYGRPLLKATRSGVAPANRGWTSEESFNIVLLCDLQSAQAPLRLVRFDAVCPKCAAPIGFDYGNERFDNRIVGFCSAARTEHIFSFDHRTGTGKSLVD